MTIYRHRMHHKTKINCTTVTSAKDGMHRTSKPIITNNECPYLRIPMYIIQHSESPVDPQ